MIFEHAGKELARQVTLRQQQPAITCVLINQVSHSRTSLARKRWHLSRVIAAVWFAFLYPPLGRATLVVEAHHRQA